MIQKTAVYGLWSLVGLFVLIAGCGGNTEPYETAEVPDIDPIFFEPEVAEEPAADPNMEATSTFVQEESVGSEEQATDTVETENAVSGEEVGATEDEEVTLDGQPVTLESFTELALDRRAILLASIDNEEILAKYAGTLTEDEVEAMIDLVQETLDGLPRLTQVGLDQEYIEHQKKLNTDLLAFLKSKTSASETPDSGITYNGKPLTPELFGTLSMAEQATILSAMLNNPAISTYIDLVGTEDRTEMIEFVRGRIEKLPALCKELGLDADATQEQVQQNLNLLSVLEGWGTMKGETASDTTEPEGIVTVHALGSGSAGDVVDTSRRLFDAGQEAEAVLMLLNAQCEPDADVGRIAETLDNLYGLLDLHLDATIESLYGRNIEEWENTLTGLQADIATWDARCKAARTSANIDGYNTAVDTFNSRLTEYKKQIEPYIEVEGILNSLGDLLEQGDCDKVIEKCDYVLSVDSKLGTARAMKASAYNNKGVTLSEAHHSDEAIQCFLKAFELDPRAETMTSELPYRRNVAASYWNKGCAHEIGSPERKRFWTEAIRYDPSNESYRSQFETGKTLIEDLAEGAEESSKAMAELMETQRQLDEAEAELDQFIKENPNFIATLGEIAAPEDPNSPSDPNKPTEVPPTE